MNSEEYVKSLREKGFFLTLNRGKIICQPLNQPMNNAELSELRKRKPEVLTHLLQRLAEDLEHECKVLANAHQTYERYAQNWPSIEKSWRQEHIPKIEANIARMQTELALFGITVNNPNSPPNI